MHRRALSTLETLDGTAGSAPELRPKIIIHRSSLPSATRSKSVQCDNSQSTEMGAGLASTSDGPKIGCEACDTDTVKQCVIVI